MNWNEYNHRYPKRRTLYTIIGLLAIVIAFFFLCEYFPAYGQEFHFTTANDDFLLTRDGYFLKYDKFEHFMRDGIITTGFYQIDKRNSWKYALAFNFAWEIRDGFRAEGFSPPDFACGCIGIFVSYQINKWLRK